MPRSRALLVRNDNQQPIDPHWLPLLDPAELEQANRNLKERQLPWHWEPITAA